jgi:hypothetical protein
VTQEIPPMRAGEWYPSFSMKILAVLLLTSVALAKSEYHPYDGPFDLVVTEVRSIAPETRSGFGKSLPLFAVNAYSPRLSYVLYCTQTGPEAGRTYKGAEVFVSGNYSFLHLWPTKRESLPDGVERGSEKTLYRVVVINDVRAGVKPDLACDIHSEIPR